MPLIFPRKTAQLLFAITCIALMTFDVTTAWSQRRSAGRSSVSAVMGRGIHSYFSGRSAEADRQLSAVINAGSRDPRAYYFRGLARLQQGRQYEAEQDMQLGAAMEARNPGSARGINQALMRVQGANRRTLESIRREGQLTASHSMNQEQQTRSRNLKTRETYVLRKPVQVPVEKLLDSSSVQIITPDTQVVPGSYTEVAPAEVAPATRPVEPQRAVEEIPVQTTQTPKEEVAPTEPAATPQPELAAEPAEPETFDLFEPPAEPATTTEATSAPEPAADLFAEEPTESAQPDTAEMEAESPAATPEAADSLFDAEPELEAEADDAGASDDLFSTETDEVTSEEPATEDPATEDPPTEDAVEEMLEADSIKEDTASDDLFDLDEPAAADIASDEEAPEAELPEASKVGSKKLLGILGRAVGDMVPKPDISIPEIMPPTGPGIAAPPAADEAFELGPEEAFVPAEELPPAPAGFPAQDETAPDPVDDLFDLEEEAPPMEEDAPEEFDLFDEPAESPSSDATEEESAEEEMPEEAGTDEQPAEEEVAEEEVAEESAEEDATTGDNSEESDEEESSSEEDEEADDDPFDLFE